MKPKLHAVLLMMLAGWIKIVRQERLGGLLKFCYEGGLRRKGGWTF